MDQDADSDALIVAAVLSGQRDRFATLVQRHQKRVYGAMWRLTGNADDAEELTQIAFFRAYFALGSFKPEYKLSTWLCQIGYHAFLNERRKRWREVKLEDLVEPEDRESDAVPELVDPGAPPSTLVEVRDTRRVIWRAVVELAQDFRAIFLMRHVDELSYEEICQVTGLPMGTVKSRLARARRQLAEKLVERL